MLACRLFGSDKNKMGVPALTPPQFLQVFGEPAEQDIKPQLGHSQTAGARGRNDSASWAAPVLLRQVPQRHLISWPQLNSPGNEDCSQTTSQKGKSARRDKWSCQLRARHLPSQWPPVGATGCIPQHLQGLSPSPLERCGLRGLWSG